MPTINMPMRDASDAEMLAIPFEIHKGELRLHFQTVPLSWARTRLVGMTVDYAFEIEDPTVQSVCTIELVNWGLIGGLNDVYGRSYLVNPPDDLEPGMRAGSRTFPSLRTVDDILEGERYCLASFLIRSNCTVRGKLHAAMEFEVLEDKWVPMIGASPISAEEHRILAAIRGLITREDLA